MVYIGGDFNARLYERLEHEKEVIGPYILERKGYITTQDKGKGVGDKTRENSDLFIDFLKTNDLCAINTMLEKEPRKRVTYKEKVPANNPCSEEYTGENTGPYDHKKYAQCDYLVIKQSRKHTVKDCETKANWYRDSDHIPIAAEIRTSMKRCEKQEKPKAAKKYHKPAKEEKKAYNDEIREAIKKIHREALLEGRQDTIKLSDWINIIENAAEATLKEVDPTIRKDYISRDTWDKIKERNEEQEKGDPENKVIALNKEIKKMAFNNRKNQKLEGFKENPEDKNKKHLEGSQEPQREVHTKIYPNEK